MRRPRPRARFLAAFVAGLLAVAVAANAATGRGDRPRRAPDAGGSRAHPQDGPDIDVRIAVSDANVTVTVVVNLAFADEIVDVAREDEEALHPVEYPGYASELLAFFKSTNVVRIDGVEVTPTDGGFDVDPGNDDLLPLFPNFGRRALTKLRQTLVYPVLRRPDRVGFVWGEFPPDRALATSLGTPAIEVVAQLLADGDARLVTFTATEPEFIWHASREPHESRFLAVPAPLPPQRLDLPLAALVALVGGGLLALRAMFRRDGAPALARRRAGALAVGTAALAGGLYATATGTVEIDDPFGPSVALPSDSDALEIFEPLHQNIYRAFDYTSESEIYDALARSVDGELLDTLYDSVYRSLVMHEEGGAVSRVQSLERERSTVTAIGVLPGTSRPTFTVETSWRVTGAVFHWGHSHVRTNQYEALYTVVGGEHGWRIAGTETLAQRRIDAGSVRTLRGSASPDADESTGR